VSGIFFSQEGSPAMKDYLEVLIDFKNELNKWIRAMDIVGLDSAGELEKAIALEWAISQLEDQNYDGA